MNAAKRKGSAKKKRPRRTAQAGPRSSEQPAAKPGTAAAAVAAPPQPWSRRLLPWGLTIFAAGLHYGGYAGLDIWPLALIFLVPFLFAIEMEAAAPTRRVLGMAMLFGFISFTGGFYWMAEMLKNFSGFSLVPVLLISSLFWIAEGSQSVLFVWLYRRARARGWPVTLSAVAAYAAKELVFPSLFPNYLANSFHMVPVLNQIADLGGPILISAVCIAVNAALYELIAARLHGRRLPRAAPITAAALAVATVVYGAIRIAQVDALAADAPHLRVGVVQTNMGIFEKRQNIAEGHRRHVVDTLALEQEQDLDLVVWPESAFNRRIPEDITNLQRAVMTFGDRQAHRLIGPIHTPLLFGGLAEREVGGEDRVFNTAYMLDARGNVTGTSDKVFLLAFGEYLPLGETFPIFYEWSPHSGRFLPGDRPRALPYGDYRILPLICYEDVIPRFTRKAVAETNPHLLVNITNDAWFGDTTEPWIHLALAKLRAIEHHRALIRATNSGVSAVVDPVGRVITHSGVMTRETLHAEVPLLTGTSVYEVLGDWPGYLGLPLIVLFAFVPRSRLRERWASRRSRARAEAG